MVHEGDSTPNKKTIELLPQRFEALDVKKRELSSILTIPCTSNLMQLEIFKNAEEQKEFLKSTIEKVPFDILNEHVDDKSAT